MNETELINLLAKIGQLLVSNGVETFNVENMVEMYGEELGIPIICSTNFTTLTISKKNGVGTKVVKTKIEGYNLQISDDINYYYQRLKNKEITTENFEKLVNDSKRKADMFPLKIKILGAGLTTMTASLAGYLSIVEFVLTIFVGTVAFFIYYRSDKWKIISNISYFLGGFFIGCISYLFFIIDSDINRNYIILGSVMPLVPGLAITNSIREIANRDYIAGLVRILQTILIILGLSAGVGAGQELISLLF